MAVNEVIYNGETLISLTEDTVTEDNLLEGVTAHDASGNQIVGTYKDGNTTYILTKDGDKIVLTGTDGSSTWVEDETYPAVSSIGYSSKTLSDLKTALLNFEITNRRKTNSVYAFVCNDALANYWNTGYTGTLGSGITWTARLASSHSGSQRCLFEITNTADKQVYYVSYHSTSGVGWSKMRKVVFDDDLEDSKDSYTLSRSDATGKISLYKDEEIVSTIQDANTRYMMTFDTESNHLMLWKNDDLTSTEYTLQNEIDLSELANDGGGDGNGEPISYLGDFRAVYPDELYTALVDWINTVKNNPENFLPKAYFKSNTHLIDVWNECVAEGDMYFTEIYGDDIEYTIQIENPVNQDYETNNFVLTLTCPNKGTYQLHINIFDFTVGRFRKVITDEDTQTASSVGHFSGFGDILFTSKTTLMNNNLPGSQSELQGRVEYTRTSLKSGILTIALSYFYASTGGYLCLSLPKISSLLGLNLTIKASRYTGVWTSNITWPEDSSYLLSMRMCKTSPNVTVNATASGSGIWLGYVTQSNNFLYLSVDDFDPQGTQIFNIYVEEE